MKKSKFKAIISILLICSLTLCLFSCGKKENSKKDMAKTASGEICNPLTGESDFNAKAAGKRPIAVVLNNAPPARPQWGLCSPDIVVEGLAEGGITRMLCLFSDVNQIPKFGSVRSARHDFIEVAEGFDAIFVHWGGSPFAYDAIDKRNIKDIDGMKNATYYARDNSRNVGIEHRGYTTGKNIKKAINDLGIREEIKNSYNQPFTFNKKDTKYDNECSSIKISFSNNYNHTFKYNSDENKYYNYMNSNKMKDADGKQMSVSNVIVLYFPSYKIINSHNCIDMDLTGGKGVIASNGTYKNITWKKGNTPKNMISLYDEDGKELKLNKGKSYIGLVPSEKASKTVIK